MLQDVSVSMQWISGPFSQETGRYKQTKVLSDKYIILNTRLYIYVHVYFISIDVVHAYRDISMVKAALKEARCGSEKFHEIVYSDAVALAHSVGIEESYPRFASNQLHRSNTPAANASQYYQRTLTIPMLDHLITELDNRFEEGTAGIIVELVQILPSELVSSSVQLKPNRCFTAI